nr:diguanylate cyclase [uncultured Dorea sp.]
MIDIMTMEQAEAEIYHFRKIFQMIRLFHLNPETQKKEVCKVGISGSENLRNIKKNCDDCIVQETFDTKEEKGKIEIFEGKLYQLITRYMEIEGEPYVMELVRGLDSDWKIGQIDHEKVVNLFMNYNDKLYKDAITDTYNRRYYEDEIKEKKDNAGVALIDLDDFKLYNDTYGHNAGDVALCTVADVIEGSIRRSDRLIRFGGDEFLLVMPGIEEDAFIKKLQMIQQKVNKTIIPGYSKIQLTISVGGVLNNGGTIETAVKHADHLMYQAKEKKNMVVTEYDDTASEVQKQQILVVDDSELNRGILIEMLKEEFDIIEAENGKEAVDKIRKYGKKLSVVLLDIVMPVMDGFEVLSVMNRNHWIEDIPVIMISSEESEGFIRKAFNFGVSDYISRPFDCDIVYQRVFNTIKLYAKQRRLMTLVSDQILEKEKNNQMMVEVLSQIVEFRNEESGLHVLHIKILTEMLLEYLVQKTDKYELSPDECHMIATASAFHDIGKIGIDEKILNKPGKLTPEEFEQIKQHTLIGASMLDKMDRYKDEPLIKIAYQICRWHHERYDGRGYPDGLLGEEIPISAQIVSIADVYDALISERAYKKAFSHEKALEMIVNGECGTFNPLLLETLVEIQPKLKEKMEEIA